MPVGPKHGWVEGQPGSQNVFCDPGCAVAYHQGPPLPDEQAVDEEMFHRAFENPAATNVEMRVDRKGYKYHMYTIEAFRGKKRVGGMLVADETEKVIKRSGEKVEQFLAGVGAKSVFVVTNVAVSKPFRGKGIGLAMYERALALAAQDGACLAAATESGWISTSQDAKNVWESLKRRFPHINDIVWGGGRRNPRRWGTA
jgi:GNAT superfamily N-acetyltransferase